MVYVVGIVIGGLAVLAVGFLIGRLYSERSSSKTIGELSGQLSRTEQELESFNERVTAGQNRIDELTRELSDRQAQLADMSRQLQEKEKSFAEQRQLLDRARETLQETFKALAADALKTSSTSFLQLAQERLSGILAQAKGDIGKQRDQIDGLVRPLRDTLQRYEQQLRELEKARQEAYGGLDQHLKMLGRTQAELQNRTSELATALRNPQARGRWGELALQRAVEIAGMTEHCDFETQVSADTATGRQRPDMVVHVPGGRRIVVDAKAPCDAYLDAVNTADESSRRSALKRYGQAIRQHIQQLGNKSYWDQFGTDGPELVVLFLPGESFFSAALETDHRLIEQAMENRVVLASPTTLITLLRAVAFGWRQEKLAENAAEIREEGKRLYERLVTFISHLNSLGKNLSDTVRNYNDAVGSLQQRLLPAARRFNALGITARRELEEPDAIDRQLRELPQVEPEDETPNS